MIRWRLAIEIQSSWVVSARLRKRFSDGITPYAITK
jgi:hypothetical protein